MKKIKTIKFMRLWKYLTFIGFKGERDFYYNSSTQMSYILDKKTKEIFEFKEDNRYIINEFMRC